MGLAELVKQGRWREAWEYLLSHRGYANLLRQELGSNYPDFIYKLAHNALLAGEPPEKVLSGAKELAPSIYDKVLGDLDTYLVSLFLENPDKALEITKSLGVRLPRASLLAKIYSDPELRKLFNYVKEQDFSDAARIWWSLSKEEQQEFLELFDKGILSGKDSFLKAMKFYRAIEELRSAKSVEQIMKILEEVRDVSPEISNAVEKLEEITRTDNPDQIVAIIETLPGWARSVAALIVLTKAKTNPSILSPRLIAELKKLGIELRYTTIKIPVEDAFTAKIIDEITRYVNEGRYSDARSLLERYRDKLSQVTVTINGRRVTAYKYLKAMIDYYSSGLQRALESIANTDWKNLDKLSQGALRSLLDTLRFIEENINVINELRDLGLTNITKQDLDRMIAAVEYALALKILENVEKEMNPRRASIYLEEAKKLLEDASRYIPEAAVPLAEITGISWEDIECIASKLGLPTRPSWIEIKARRGML